MHSSSGSRPAPVNGFNRAQASISISSIIGSTLDYLKTLNTQTIVCSGPEQSVSGIRKLASNSHSSGRALNGTNGPGQPASSSNGPGRPISGSAGSGRPMSSSGGPGQPVNSPHDLQQPMNSLGSPGRAVSGLGRSIPAGRTVNSGPGRPVNSLGPGRTLSNSGLPTKPKCTVVSETISSKNIISRSSNGQINGMKPLFSGHRSAQGPQRLPFPTGYKRPREYEDDDDEYDSEMDDFIDDEGEPQKKYPSTFEKSLAMTAKNIKMKETMPYVTWRAVGRSSRRRKPRV